MEIISAEVETIYCVPQTGDSVILPCSEEYSNVYGYSDKSGTVSQVLFDYRCNEITIYVE